MAAAPCDSRVRRGFRGSAGGPPVTQPAPLSVASPFTTPLLGRVLPLGSLRALACSLPAVSSALAPYLLFQLTLCSLKLSLPCGSLFCPGPGSRCQQRTPRYTAPSAQVSLSSEPGCGSCSDDSPQESGPTRGLQLLSSICLKRLCGSFTPVCSGWLGAGVQTAVRDWCVDGQQSQAHSQRLVAWASPHQWELWRGLEASSYFSSFQPEPWVRRLGTCSGTYPGCHSLSSLGVGLGGDHCVEAFHWDDTLCPEPVFLGSVFNRLHVVRKQFFPNGAQ